ncbi:hypothetical protein SO802_008857 [Lithocarpus litseifolius]|uniref:RNase H type-1 domain-containing protein n=1 Tax=Lithocarpus litseifolius TaxID=425828 RepID=A0AAW2DDN2_9ROSI
MVLLGVRAIPFTFVAHMLAILGLVVVLVWTLDFRGRLVWESWTDWSCQLGNFYDDICCLAGRLQYVEFRSIRRSPNGVAHSFARYARHLSEDIFWLEDSPPPALKVLYLDSISIAN